MAATSIMNGPLNDGAVGELLELVQPNKPASLPVLWLVTELSASGVVQKAVASYPVYQRSGGFMGGGPCFGGSQELLRCSVWRRRWRSSFTLSRGGACHKPWPTPWKSRLLLGGSALGLPGSFSTSTSGRPRSAVRGGLFQSWGHSREAVSKICADRSRQLDWSRHG